MTLRKKPYRTLAELEWEPTHFTREECRRAVRAVLEEDRRALEARRLRRKRTIPAAPADGA